LILFLFILLLEDLGYMARAAFLMDRIMGGAGLHGRAFIPLLSSFACAIPGIMATRVIDNKRDRLTTIMVAPLMTCSARIPVYTLIISAFVPNRQVFGILGLQGLVMFGLYAIGIFSALAVSFVANHFFWRESATPPFMLELPDYKLPQLRSVLMNLYQRAMAFLKRAGTTIFSMMILIWFLASFPRPPVGATEPAIDFSLARYRLCDRGWQGSGRTDRAGAGGEMEPGDGAGVAGLVHLRTAMRFNLGGHQARDRRLALDDRDVPLHAGAGLHRRVHHLSDRAGTRLGLTRQM
jgi:hypothetical protein